MLDFFGFILDCFALGHTRNEREERRLNGCLWAGIGVLVLLLLAIIAMILIPALL